MRTQPVTFCHGLAIRSGKGEAKTCQKESHKSKVQRLLAVQIMDTQLILFPMRAADGGRRQTETANRETLFRLVQSVPSKNAENTLLDLEG
jgi:hypothetical protein